MAVNGDLANERAKCSFKSEELTHLLDGGKDKTEERRKTEKHFLSIPEIKDSVPPEYMSHKEKYESAVRKACAMIEKIKHLQEEEEGGGVEQYRNFLGGLLGSAILKDGSPITLHYVMFIPTLMGQGTVDQQAEWIGRAFDCSIIGTYAQTELGHGTFIRGLETVAEYDPQTQEFVLNSPTLTSYKWWPGGLGHTANYAIVVAQLYTQGVCHGIHPFIVQLRDEDTHVPMPGIKIGEIGAKMGMNGTNNGFLGFDRVRIPRVNMLMKNAKVLQDGTYVKSPSSKLTYGTMMFVRVVLVQDMANYLAKAVIIATRYSAVRRQSQPKPDAPEPQILDYVTQQYKIFPNIATCFALRLSAQWLWDLYNNITAELDSGVMERLPELHALACCLKAVSTNDVSQGVETCRLSCGGHGYMSCSSFPTMYGLVTAACTYEGENTVLLLQTARYLVKIWQQVKSGADVPPTVAYLKTSPKKQRQKWSNSLAGIVQGFQIMATGKIADCVKNIERGEKKGIPSEDVWNMNSIKLVSAAEAHCRTFIIEKFAEQTDVLSAKVSAPLQKVLKTFSKLYATYWALKCSGDLLRYTSITGKDLDVLQESLEDCLAVIRPDAVGIVDSFDICDEILSSALGAYDGRVYERLMEEALKSPLNAEPVNESFHLHLKPLMKANI